MRPPRPPISEFPGSNASAGIELQNRNFHTIFAREGFMQKIILMAVAGMALSSHAVAAEVIIFSKKPRDNRAHRCSSGEGAK